MVPFLFPVGQVGGDEQLGTRQPGCAVRRWARQAVVVGLRGDQDGAAGGIDVVGGLGAVAGETGGLGQLRLPERLQRGVRAARATGSSNSTSTTRPSRDQTRSAVSGLGGRRSSMSPNCSLPCGPRRSGAGG